MPRDARLPVAVLNLAVLCLGLGLGLGIAASPAIAENTEAPPARQATERIEYVIGPDTPFGLIVAIRAPDGEAGFDAELLDLMARTEAATRADDNAQLYRFVRTPDRPGEVLLLEAWPDLNTLHAHLHAPHTRELLAALTDLSIDLTILRPLAGDADAVITEKPRLTTAPASSHTPRVMEQIRDHPGRHFEDPVMVHTRLVMTPSQSDAARAELADIAATTADRADGVRFYAAFADAESPDTYHVLESWDDVVALRLNDEAPRHQRLLQTVARYASDRRLTSALFPLTPDMAE